jgi:hypothetical protein
LRVEALEKAWRDQAGAAPLSPLLAFGPTGLTLGAGTVLAPAEDLDCADDWDATIEARLHALLSAAYCRPIAPQAIRFIRRGAVSWRAGDKAMASMHLAMTSLPPLRDVQDASRRLFMADALMKAGMEPDIILRALDAGGDGAWNALRRYDAQQRRNPAGSGRVSGRWTLEEAPSEQHAADKPATPARQQRTGPVRPTPAPPSVEESPFAAEGADAAALEEGAALLRNAVLFSRLASIAGRLSGPAVFFSVLLTPTNKLSDDIPISGHPGMRLQRPIGSPFWRFVYKDKAGVQQTVVQRADGMLRTANGMVVGRIDRAGNAVILLPAVKALAGEHGEGAGPVKPVAGSQDEQPNLCPKPVKDYHGGGPGSPDKLHEDRVKLVVNPDFPTPTGMGYSLPNPETRRGRVIFDDCQRKTGMMVEAKGPRYSKFLEGKIWQGYSTGKSEVLEKVTNKLVRQGTLQVRAAHLAGDRPIRWYCHDLPTCNYIQSKFKSYGHGLENITFGIVP